MKDKNIEVIEVNKLIEMENHKDFQINILKTCYGFYLAKYEQKNKSIINCVAEYIKREYQKPSTEANIIATFHHNMLMQIFLVLNQNLSYNNVSQELNNFIANIKQPTK